MTHDAERQPRVYLPPIFHEESPARTKEVEISANSELKICAQILLKIRKQLDRENSADGDSKGFSHPQVFGQCRQLLRQNKTCPPTGKDKTSIMFCV
jgi:prephenate dehydratase